MIAVLLAAWRFILGGFLAGALVTGPSVWWLRDQMQAHSQLQQARNTIRVIERQGAATTRAETRYIQGAERVRTITRTITLAVPRVLPVETDARYPLPVGLVRLHDNAVLSTVPAAPGQSDAAPSTATASDLATAIADNYGACHLNSRQLEALQDWVRAQARVR